MDENGNEIEIDGKEIEKIKEELKKLKKDAEDKKKKEDAPLPPPPTKDEAVKTISRVSVGKNLEDIIVEIGTEKDPISTGFPSLDKALGCGGFREGCLYAIGAGTSMGKTTFVANIADNIALSDIEGHSEQGSIWEIPDGKKVLIFSLETNRKKFFLKSLSKIMCKCDLSIDKIYTKTALQIALKIKNNESWSKGSEELFNEARNIYKSYKDRIFIEGGVEKFGIGKIRRTLQCFGMMGKTPSLVIVDYLQLMDPFESGKFDLGYNISRNVTALKALCEEFKIPIILISSFNRENYYKEAGLDSFKGSGEIEYSSDVVMALQPQLPKEDNKEEGKGINTTEKPTYKLRGATNTDPELFKKAMRETPRKIDLVILKNRDFSPWEKIGFNYYSAYDNFEEMDDESKDGNNKEVFEKNEMVQIVKKREDIKKEEAEEEYAKNEDVPF